MISEQKPQTQLTFPQRQKMVPANVDKQSQNPMYAQNYQPDQMQNEILLPYYLQQREIIETQLTIFTQKPNAAESLQMTMNSYPMGGSSITSKKPLMGFTGTYHVYSVEDYRKAAI